MKLSMVGIIVTDMERAIAFYEFIGFSVSQKHGSDYVELDNATIRISLNSIKMIEETFGFRPEITGSRIELAFELESRKDVNTLCDKVVASGYKLLKSPWLAPWGQHYALIEDVDGNILSIFSNE